MPSFLSGHTAPQRHDSLDDHGSSPSDPRHGRQATGGDQQTDGRPRGGRVSGGRRNPASSDSRGNMQQSTEAVCTAQRVFCSSDKMLL